MTESKSLRIVYSSASSIYKPRWVRLEQIMPSEAKAYANVQDLYNMYLSAATGKSAQSLRPDGCPVEFDGDKIIAYLGFYIWPSNPSITFALSTTLGEIGPRRAVAAIREFSAMINNSNRYALPYFMESVTIVFETPIFNERNEQIAGVSWSVVDGIWLVFSEQIFAAVRISGVAIGVSVVLKLTFQKGLLYTETTPDDWEDWGRGPGGEIIINSLPSEKVISDIIDGVDIAISVTYQNADGTLSEDEILNEDVENTTLTIEQNSVTLPDCLKAVLSFCPDAFDPFGLLSTFCDQITDMDVYYNACNGDILGSKDKGNGRSYCQKLETISEISPWLPVEGL